MDILKISGAIEREVLVGKRISITLFTIFELLHIYPNAKIVKGYFVIDDENYFNVENYEYLLNSDAFGGAGIIYMQRRITPKDFLNDGTLCCFLKCQYPDIFMNTGIYIYPWMVKHIKLLTGRYLYKATIIEDDIFLKMEKNSNFAYINEYPDGYQINF